MLSKSVLSFKHTSLLSTHYLSDVRGTTGEPKYPCQSRNTDKWAQNDSGVNAVIGEAWDMGC